VKVVGWSGVTKAPFYGEDRRGFSYGEMSGELNFNFTINSAKMSRALKITCKCCLIASSLIILHCTRTDSAKNDNHHALLRFSLSCPQRKDFLLHPHYINWSEGRFLLERNILSILGPGYLCDRCNVVK
jgi:hypothetical protein